MKFKIFLAIFTALMVIFYKLGNNKNLKLFESMDEVECFIRYVLTFYLEAFN